MGHGGETIVCSPQNHHSSNHQPQVGGPYSKKQHLTTKVNGSGISQHDNSNGSSKVSKKSNAHSTPQTHPKGKSLGMGKARPGQGNVCSQNGNKANLVALQNQTPFHLLKQQSLTGRQMNAATPRFKSFSPPTLHPMPSGEQKARTGSPVLPGNQQKDKEQFYAGARFETHPSHIGLPVPPLSWTAPIQRSQSQPSSPVPTSLPQKGISVDLATLFGHTDSAVKSASFPGDRLMDALMKMEDERKKKKNEINNTVSIGSLPKAQIANSYDSSNDETDELKRTLGIASFTPPVKAASRVSRERYHSQGSEMSPSKYQDISDQLKNLLKVAA